MQHMLRTMIDDIVVEDKTTPGLYIICDKLLVVPLDWSINRSCVDEMIYI